MNLSFLCEECINLSFLCEGMHKPHFFLCFSQELLRRSKSGCKYLSFSCVSLRANEEEREWVRAIWNKWFDEVFPPTPEVSEDEEEVEETTTEIVEKKEEKKK